jgi:hypothetical protein
MGTVKYQLIIWLALAMWLAACGPKFKVVEVDPREAGREPQREAAASGLPEVVSEPAEPKPAPLEGFQRLDWRVLRGLDVKTGRASAELTAFAGANIRISGFMVPFDDDDEQVTEFLLVPQAGMCIHTPPPPANQIILVEVAAGGANRVEWDKEVNVYGQFQIADGNSPYGKTGFKISAVRARAD